MGLGKTLIVLALIITNFHDKKPLIKPECGFSRASNYPQSVVRYLPRARHAQGANYRVPTRGWKKGRQNVVSKENRSEVGIKLSDGMNTKRKKLGAGDSLFGHLVPKDQKKDSKQKVKSTNHKNLKLRTNYSGGSSLSSNSGSKSTSAFDALPSPDTSDNEGEPDEFDTFIGGNINCNTLSPRL